MDATDDTVDLAQQEAFDAIWAIILARAAEMLEAPNEAEAA
jgi:hypothetical protein